MYLPWLRGDWMTQAVICAIEQSEDMLIQEWVIAHT